MTEIYLHIRCAHGSANIRGGSSFGTDEMTADPLCVVLSKVDKSPGGTPAQWKEGEDFF